MNSYIAYAFLGDVFCTIHFHKIGMANGDKIFVLLKERQGNKHAFNMEKREGQWRLVYAPKPCDMIVNGEQKLSQLIRERFK